MLVPRMERASAERASTWLRNDDSNAGVRGGGAVLSVKGVYGAFRILAEILVTASRYCAASRAHGAGHG